MGRIIYTIVNEPPKPISDDDIVQFYKTREQTIFDDIFPNPHPISSDPLTEGMKQLIRLDLEQANSQDRITLKRSRMMG